MHMNPSLVTANGQQLIFVSYVSPNLPTKQLFKTFRVKPPCLTLPYTFYLNSSPEILKYLCDTGREER